MIAWRSLPKLIVAALVVAAIGVSLAGRAQAADTCRPIAPGAPIWGSGTWGSFSWASGANQPQQSFYDASSRLTSVVDPVNGSAQYTYDVAGNIRSIAVNSASALTLLQVIPSSGPVGATINICGTGFGTIANTSVAFNGIAATPSSVTATQITVPVPAGATNGLISVTTPAGTVSSSNAFTVGAPSAPTISGVSPGSANPGDTVTITGAAFDTASSKVFVNGQSAQLLTASAGSLTATAPSASSGHVTVETPAGAATSSSDLIIPPLGYATTAIDSSQRVSLGQTAAVTVSSAGKIALVLFDATAGQRASFVVNSSALNGSLCLYAPNGSTVGLCGSGSAGRLFAPPTASWTGTYTLGVLPGAGLSGSASISLYDATDVVASTTQGAPPLAVNIVSPGQMARVTFSGTAGDHIGLATQQSGGLPGHCFQVTLINPDGATTSYSKHQCSQNDLSGDLILPATGTYTLTYENDDPVTGTVTLTVSPTIQTTMTQGSSLALNIALPGQNARVTFSGTAGDHIGLATQQSGGLSGACFDVALINPDGSTTSYTKFQCTSDVSGDLVLPSTGVYTYTYRSESPVTGTATVSVSQTIRTTTTQGSSLPLNIALPGQNARVTFSGTAGDHIGLATQQSGMSNQCFHVALINPDGSTTTYTGSNCISDASPDLVLPTTGTYTYTYAPSGILTGTATVTVSQTIQTTTTQGSSLAVNIALPGQNARVTFSGTAGDHIGLTTQQSGGLTSACYNVALINPDGTTTTYTASSCGDNLSGDLVLPTTGTYTYTYKPGGALTGTITVTVSQTIRTTTTQGSSLPLNIALPGQNARVTFSGTAGNHIGLATQQSGGLGGDCFHVTLINPDGTTTSYDKHLCATSDVSGDLVLPATGTFTYTYRSDVAVTGTVTFSVSQTILATATIDGGSVPLSTTTPGQNLLVSFAGSSGGTAIVALTVSSGFASGCYSVKITNPDASTLQSGSSCSTTYSSGSLTLPQSGTYAIWVTPLTPVSGSVTVGVTSH